MKFLIFGAGGSIGNYIYNELIKTCKIYGTSTKLNTKYLHVTSENMDSLLDIDAVNGVVWANGANINDNVTTFNFENYNKIMDANVCFILKTVNFLIHHNKLNQNANVVIISSIYENVTRANKLSYSISKTALKALTSNLSFVLGNKNILINNILPGVLDNSMTRSTLSQKEINFIINHTPGSRLINFFDILNTVEFFLFKNTGITGQSIKIDLGFTNFISYQ